MTDTPSEPPHHPAPLTGIRGARIRDSTIAFLGYTALMLVLERRLRGTGGPGIIPFELARTAARAESIMTRWGPRGRRAARTSLWLDFGYMLAYGVLVGLHVDRARRMLGHSPTPLLMVAGAVAGDAVEGVSLLKVLSGSRIAVNARRAHLAASTKFALLIAAGGYVVAARVGERPGDGSVPGSTAGSAPPLSVRDAALAEVSSHRRLLRTGRDGRLLSAAMLPLLERRPPAGYGVLTTTGRRTGIPRSKCVRVIRRGDRAYLVALRPPHLAVSRPDAVQAWVLNMRADPRVRLRIGDGAFDGAAFEITGAPDLARARAAICDTVYPFDYGECLLHLRGVPTRSKIRRLHRYWFDTGIPVVIRLN
ncbi:nitroreductase family deazaflavin-dependent oxidoreductase [[Mycobacterium] manitobense]|nr:nitroreductase family deazaflavin-dependent oxidoreductase [[Mycobacterium] manitobense]